MFDFLWVPLLVGSLTVAPAAQPAAPPPDRPFARLPQNFLEDTKRLAHRDSLILLGAGGALAIAAAQADHDGRDWAQDAPAGSWTRIGRVGGDGWVQGGIAVATWGLGELTQHRLTAHVGSDLIRAQLLNMVTTRVVKIAVDRQRPSGGGHAFPSGHTSATFTSAAVVHRHFGWKAGAPAYLAAGFVGLTRVRDGAHWVSDTVFGAAMGLTAGWAVTRGHDSRAWSITPAPLPGGGAIVVRW